MNKTARLKRLSRHLLATTCLTVAAAGAAHATTITENPEPGGFGNTLATSTLLQGLSIGTNVLNTVVGETNNTANKAGAGGNNEDAFFTLLDAIPGSTFSYGLTVTNTTPGTLEIVNTAGVEIGSTTSPGGFAFGTNSSATLVTSGTGIVPTNGEIVAAVIQGGTNEGASILFSLGVTASIAPEPGTFTEIGLGLAGAAVALRRRLKTRKA